MRLLVLLLFGVAFVEGLQAQDIKFKLLVQNEETGDPIEDAILSDESTEFIALSDHEGIILLDGELYNNKLVYLSRLGYNSETYIFPASIVAGQTYTISLQPNFLGLPEVILNSTTLTGGMNHVSMQGGSGYLIDQSDIQLHQYTDVNRLFHQVPGVQIREEEGLGLRPNIGIRGSGSERSSKITLMEDGVLIAPAPYSAPAAYYFPMISGMNSAEISKGVDNVRFGPYTTGGAVNFITRPIPHNAEVGGQIALGNFGTTDVGIHAGTRIGQFGILAETYLNGGDGFRQIDGGNLGNYSKNHYGIKLGWNSKLGSKYYQSIQLKAGLTNENSNETYLGLSSEDFELNPFRRYVSSENDNITSEQKQINLRYFIEVNRRCQFEVTGYLQTFDRNWYKLDKVSKDEGSAVSISTILNDTEVFSSEFEVMKGMSEAGKLFVKANNRSYVSRGVQINNYWSKQGKNYFLELKSGIRAHYDEMDRYQWVDTYGISDGRTSFESGGDGGSESNRIESATSFSGFIQAGLQSGKWNFIPGLRFENILLKRIDFGKKDPDRTGNDLNERDNKVNALIPALGVKYRLDEGQQFFGGYYKGFAPPGSHPETNSEDSDNFELGYESGQGRTQIYSAVYYRLYKNLLGSDLASGGGNGSGDLFNGGEAVAAGIEFEIRHLFSLSALNESKTIPFKVGYTYTSAQFKSDFESDFDPWGSVENGDYIPYIPQHQIYLSGGYTTENFVVDAALYFQTDMRAIAGQEPIGDSRYIPAFYTLDLSMSYKFSESMALFASLNNVFNNNYLVSDRPAGLRPGSPRMWKVGVSFELE